MAGFNPGQVNLQPRGRRLWADMNAKYPDLDPIQGELLLEACRMVDYMERLHGILDGNVEAFAEFKMPRSSAEIHLIINDPMKEVRAFDLALKQITNSLTQMGAAAGEAKATDTADDLAAKRERRRAEELQRRADGQSATPDPVGS